MAAGLIIRTFGAYAWWRNLPWVEKLLIALPRTNPIVVIAHIGSFVSKSDRRWDLPISFGCLFICFVNKWAAGALVYCSEPEWSLWIVHLLYYLFLHFGLESLLCTVVSWLWWQGYPFPFYCLIPPCGLLSWEKEPKRIPLSYLED